MHWITHGLVHRTAQLWGKNRQRFNEPLNYRDVCPTTKKCSSYMIMHLLIECCKSRRTDRAETLPPLSPFLNIVEQAIIKCVESGNQGWHIWRQSIHWEQLRDRNETRRQCIPLGELRQRVLMQASARNLATKLWNALHGIGSCRPTFLVALIVNIFNKQRIMSNVNLITLTTCIFYQSVFCT